MIAFPKCKYPSDPEHAACVVDDAAAETALGAGWFDTPAEAKEAHSMRAKPVFEPLAPAPVAAPVKGK